MIKINKYQHLLNKIFFLLFSCTYSFSQTDSAPSITADGRQAFCAGNPINIVTDFTITDVDDTTIATFFIQISSNYQANFDLLELTGNHPNISTSWNSLDGKLTLTSSTSGSEMLLTDLENAVKDVVFSTTSTFSFNEKFFSLSIGDANYLPSTDHFYEFVPNQGITWQNAKTAAENRTYFGRQGYLATLISREEAEFAGKQASGAGWIGGSDEEREGEWKWVTGPEAGTVFWNGAVSGTTPNFAFWNDNEPNDFRGNNSTGEDYAHITDPSIGIPGAWNDLPNEGGTNLYIPRGYIVEYGKPGDPPLNIVASTSIYIPKITSRIEATICQSGTATISATSNEGTILWFDTILGGTQIATGTSFTTPILNINTTYFVTVSVNGCTSLERLPVNVTVNQEPTITTTTDDLICSGTAILSASASAGQVLWYDTATSTTPIFIGDNFTTPNLTNTTSYFVEANNSNCISSTRTEVTAVIDSTIPEFDLVQDTYVFCEDIGSIDLETINPKGNYRYVWKKEGSLISGDLSSITINSSGTYSVRAISTAGCQSQEKTIVVNKSEKASITKDDILIIDDSTNNSIEIVTQNLGIGEYEFSLDDKFGIYKNQGTFDNITTGLHTLYIRDKLGCGIQEYQFSILAYPKFFTPNNDGENDVWKITGFDKNFYNISNIYIYNRFGKLIYTIKEDDEGWNGNYQNKKLPANSYWFSVTLTDINGFLIQKKGNFSLIRK